MFAHQRIAKFEELRKILWDEAMVQGVNTSPERCLTLEEEIMYMGVYKPTMDTTRWTW